MKNLRKSIGIAAIAIAASLTLGACSSASTSTPATPAPSDSATQKPADGGFAAPGDDDKGGKNNPVKIGVVGASGPQWATLESLANENGIYLDLVDFTDYQQPNPQLDAGDLDLNQFQHILFLAQYNNESGSDLAAIGSTAIYPLGLYSQDYDSVDAIPDGSKIAVPNDGTNQARALGVLQSAGLITLNSGVGALVATPEDIDTATSRVEVVPVAADQTARSLADKQIAGAIINNDYVADTGLEPTAAIAKDDPAADASKPFINIWASRAQDATNPVYLKLVELAQTAEVEADLQENSGGTAVLVHSTPEELAAYLADARSQLKS
ncbi:MetQ/NlpA family ABC transporter substrate-binding protein [Rarobacter faecitabidus]|uniref:D-methionine transport system substrate-binding protein n=1 Tax=Rarobacter faecitabidus TaxID=13243 RepID=A0A542ZUH7_RARFA|nr:MetQ/NlpA family ABC transporter substrate-binding protein [Rarobacter faecitabidus]TQL63850.1 D-methionine transport system substrate-binding protein [Rarobacter faecitabidus]